jgi:hypothetical protein
MGAWPGFIWLRIDNLRALGNTAVNPSSTSRVRTSASQGLCLMELVNISVLTSEYTRDLCDV